MSGSKGVADMGFGPVEATTSSSISRARAGPGVSGPSRPSRSGGGDAPWPARVPISPSASTTPSGTTSHGGKRSCRPGIPTNGIGGGTGGGEGGGTGSSGGGAEGGG